MAGESEGLGVRAELEVDAGPVELDLAARIDTLGSNIRRELEALKKPHGRYQMVYGAAAVPAGGIAAGGLALVANPDGPPPGLIWLVQWVSIFPTATPFAAVANLNAIVCVGRAPAGSGGAAPGSIAVNGSDIVVPGQPVPAAINVPDKTVVLPQEQLYVVLNGGGLGAAGTQYMFTAAVISAKQSEEVYFW